MGVDDVDDYHRGYEAGWDAAIGDAPGGLAAMLIGGVLGAGFMLFVLYIAGAM